MARYQLRATNNTAHAWYFALYQQQPKSLDTVAWKVLSLSKPQNTATSQSLSWTMDLVVTVPQRQEREDTYISGLSLKARLGYKYVLYLEGGFLKIKEAGRGRQGCICFQNDSSIAENMAILVGGSIIAMQKNVAHGETASFKLLSDFYCGLFSEISEGEIISADEADTSVQISIPEGQGTVTVSADVIKGEVELSSKTSRGGTDRRVKIPIRRKKKQILQFRKH